MLTSLENSLGRAIDSKMEQDRFVSIDADTTLGVNDNIVHVTGFSGAVAVTLPPVGRCAGRLFAIHVLDDSGTNNITVQDQNDSRAWTDQVIDNTGSGSLLLYCDGEKFWILFADLT